MWKRDGELPVPTHLISLDFNSSIHAVCFVSNSTLCFFFSQLNSKLEWTNLYADFRAFYLHPQSILVIRNFEQIQWACFIPSFAYIYTSISTFLTFEIRSCRKVLKNSFNGPKEFSCRKTIYSISFDWFTHGDSVEPTVICWLLGLVRLFVRSFLRSFIHLPKMQTD